jgi:hypothetical protein
MAVSVAAAAAAAAASVVEIAWEGLQSEVEEVVAVVGVQLGVCRALAAATTIQAPS